MSSFSSRYQDSRNLSLKDEGKTIFGNVGNHSALQRHIPEERNTRLHACENIKTGREI
jgi:hypothetical protein